MDAMKKGREGRRQVATLLRRLNAVAKEVDLPNADQVTLPTFHDYSDTYLRIGSREYRPVL